MKLIMENWRRFMHEVQSSDFINDYIYGNQDVRKSFADKISSILFAYHGKDSISSLPLEDRIKLAAQPNQNIQISGAQTINTPNEKEINLFRQEAKNLFMAMDEDIKGRKKIIKDTSRKFDKYIDFFIQFTNDSPDKSYEGRLSFAQSKINELRSQIGYETPENFPSETEKMAALLATVDNITPEQQKIKDMVLGRNLGSGGLKFDEKEIDFVSNLKVKRTGKNVNHPLSVGSVKRKKADKMSDENSDFKQVIDNLLSSFRPKNRQLGGRVVAKYNKAIDDLVDSMKTARSAPKLKSTHDEAMKQLGLLANAFFSDKQIPVSDYIKDEHQISNIHYFNPKRLKDDYDFYISEAEYYDNKYNDLSMQLKDENSKAAPDEENVRRLKGNMETILLRRNIQIKKAKLIKDQMFRYKKAFEDRLKKKQSAIELPEPHGSRQFAGYADATGHRNLVFGGFLANIWKETGVIDRTLDSPNDIKIILNLYLKELGGPIENPVEKELSKSKDPNLSMHQYYDCIFSNYVLGKNAKEDKVGKKEKSSEPSKRITSIDQLSDDDYLNYVELVDFDEAPVQGTGLGGMIDMKDEKNIEWFLGEINKIISGES